MHHWVMLINSVPIKQEGIVRVQAFVVAHHAYTEFVETAEDCQYENYGESQDFNIQGREKVQKRPVKPRIDFISGFILHRDLVQVKKLENRKCHSR